MDLVKLIQSAIDDIVDKKYKDDPCKPTFIVSYTAELSNKILLTIKHNGIAITKTIFPPEITLAYDGCDLEYEIQSLYNATM
jgi:hypothetical protein